MVELECPWCEQVMPIDMADLLAAAEVTCDACRVTVDLVDPVPEVVARAA
jgi:hypothetical protein